MKTCATCYLEKSLEEFALKSVAIGARQSNCRACVKEYNTSWYIKNRERLAAQRAGKKEILSQRNKKWRSANIDKDRERKVLYYQKNQEKMRSYSETYRKANPQLVAASQAAWFAANPGKRVAYQSKRRSSQLQATPVWAEDFLIEEAYDLAQRRSKATGFEWQVDHIVPLISSKVCGLHVHNNLQVIPGKENLSKSNRYWPDMPGDNIGTSHART